MEGRENVPFRGPALLVANHMSHVDGFLIGASRGAFHAFHGVEAVLLGPADGLVLPPDQRYSGRDAHAARSGARASGRRAHELAAGHVVCIFAEGAITRTGNMLPFKRGMEKIVEGLDVPIIPVHLDRLWGSIFSFERGRFFWKWPKRIPYPVTVSFGAPMPATSRRTKCGRPSRNWRARRPAQRKTADDTLAARA